jgi:circadian clock protein KaiB
MSPNYPRTMYTGGDIDEPHFSLRLYIAGGTEKSITARANLRRACEMHLAGRFDIEVIDLAEHPDRALGDKVLATPTLVRRLPRPIKRMVGDLSNTEKLLAMLDVRAKAGSR